MKNCTIIATNFFSTGHDFSACVIRNNRVHAINMERIDRIKKSPRWVRHLFSSKDIKDQYDSQIASYFKDFISDENAIFVNYPLIPSSISNFGHHSLHASSAFLPSKFDESAILCIDFSWLENNDEVISDVTQSLWFWKWNKIENLHKTVIWWKNHWGIGRCYSFICMLLDLGPGSVMWLSSYGNKDSFSELSFFDYDEWDVYTSADIIWLFSDANDIDFSSITDVHRQNFNTMFWINDRDYINPHKDITKSIFADIAAKLQYETERAIVYLATHLQELTKSKNICLAWWVALNINANSRIIQETAFENIFVQAAATDDGLSLWLAYHKYHSLYPNAPRIPMIHASLWKSYSETDIWKVLLKYEDILKVRHVPKSYEYAAKAISKWLIIWWFTWWSEFWPRALWNRSLFGDASSIAMKNKMNDVKFRQAWRPVAPLLLEEDLGIFFEDAEANYFMTTIASIKPEKRSEIPAVVHIDGTARYQTVNQEQNEKTYKLLKSLKSIKWNSVIMNTSFNVNKEPIVETPEDAIKMFLSTNIDLLVLENFVITKERVYGQFRFDASEEISKYVQN